MSDNYEQFEIANCPLCDKAHNYDLKVERSIVIKLMTSNDMNEKPRRVSVTRIFNCPDNEKKFQAEVILYDTSANRIKSVEVVGLSKEQHHG